MDDEKETELSDGSQTSGFQKVMQELLNQAKKLSRSTVTATASVGLLEVCGFHLFYPSKLLVVVWF